MSRAAQVPRVSRRASAPVLLLVEGVGCPVDLINSNETVRRLGAGSWLAKHTPTGALYVVQYGSHGALTYYPTTTTEGPAR